MIFLALFFLLHISLYGEAMEEIFTFNATTVQSKPDTSWMILDPNQEMYRDIVLLNPESIKDDLDVIKNQKLTGTQIAQRLMNTDKEFFLNKGKDKSIFFTFFLGSLIDYADRFVESKYRRLGAGALEYALTKCVTTSSLIRALKATYPATIIYESEDSFLGQNNGNNSHGANEVGKILMRIRDGFNNQNVQVKPMTNSTINSYRPVKQIKIFLPKSI